ncbi:MAG: hypothetical protein QOD57_4842 [Actinomycetota bacterium]|jgi:ethylbenzene dioxygenase beta subunit|nr:hypothetical protein [Actinomycetota bacterium]MDQ1507115.1 hypothetical protein [Actinomycetota bacterium]
MQATATRLPLADPRFETVLDFLYEEAELLDENRTKEWLELLSEDVVYTMPVRSTANRSEGAGFDTRMGYYEESYDSLRHRVVHLDVPSAWSMEPPPRTRRYVTNVRVWSMPGTEDLEVRSYLFFVRLDGDDTAMQCLSAARHDVMSLTNGGARLRRREILVDHTNLPATHLAVFL